MGSKPYEQKAENAEARSPAKAGRQGKAALESPQKRIPCPGPTTSKPGRISEECSTYNATPSRTQPENVTYFRNLVITHSDALTSSCIQWEEIRNKNLQNLEEDVEGEIRSVIGQAQLLMAERFVQFGKLVDNFENPEAGEKEITPTDLQGFWDMIFFQVEDVVQKFQKLHDLKERNWIRVEEKKASVSCKKTTKGRTAKASASRNEAARKRLQEAKRAMRERKRLQEEAARSKEIKAEIFTPEDCHRSQTKNDAMVTNIAKAIEISL